MTSLNVTCPSCGHYDTVHMETSHLQSTGDEECVNFSCPSEKCNADFVVRVTCKYVVDVTATDWIREERP